MNEWKVPGKIILVHDGDTVKVDLDLGWHLHYIVSVRVAHINAPELATEEGKVALAYAQTILRPDADVIITSHSLDKYGRTLASITLKDGRDFGTLMLESENAVPYEG